MKKIAPIILLVPILVSCSLNRSTGRTTGLTEEYKAVPIINFDGTEEDKALYEVKNGYGNGGMFLSAWKRDNFKINNEIGEFSLSDTNDHNYGVEVKTYQGYLYGYFGARMKTFKRQGTVQSIFTYNGGYFAWDEIDIEFLGKDTTTVQFNYFHNGEGGHEYIHHLGFDSSEAFHDYGFKWDRDTITWFVDFKPVYPYMNTYTWRMTSFLKTKFKRGHS